MTPDLPDIAAFITARRGEDEAAAKAASKAKRDAEEWHIPIAMAAHVALHDPTRVLRTVTAKRAIIGEQTCDHAPTESMYGTVCRTCVDWQDAPVADGGETEFGIAIPQAWPCRVARSEAAAWSDHPDYRPEWEL